MKTAFKKSIALLLCAIMLASSVITVGAADFEAPIANYDKYDHYVRYDFENYGSNSNHGAYIKSTTLTNADGELCNPLKTT